ncbi:transposase [Methylobacterium sp. WL64]|uniref:transposase n=1 Tax=Methylobacterium sp. WL64 TaxID=2603894 RepID=UPI001FEDC239|nr:transposase [Methylobacterium sp. WL64]
MARVLERFDPPGSPAAKPARQVLARIAWHLRMGGAWRMLPAGVPSWRTVYGWFRRWSEKELFEALMRALARRQRCHGGRHSTPRLAIIDTQSITCNGMRGPCATTVPKNWSAAMVRQAHREGVTLIDAEGDVLALASLIAANALNNLA